jgi:hypothetical protein
MMAAEVAKNRVQRPRLEETMVRNGHVMLATVVGQRLMWLPLWRVDR